MKKLLSLTLLLFMSFNPCSFAMRSHKIEVPSICGTTREFRLTVDGKKYDVQVENITLGFDQKISFIIKNIPFMDKSIAKKLYTVALCNLHSSLERIIVKNTDGKSKIYDAQGKLIESNCDSNINKPSPSYTVPDISIRRIDRNPHSKNTTNNNHNKDKSKKPRWESSERETLIDNVTDIVKNEVIQYINGVLECVDEDKSKNFETFRVEYGSVEVKLCSALDRITVDNCGNNRTDNAKKSYVYRNDDLLNMIETQVNNNVKKKIDEMNAIPYNCTIKKSNTRNIKKSQQNNHTLNKGNNKGPRKTNNSQTNLKAVRKSKYLSNDEPNNTNEGRNKIYNSHEVTIEKLSAMIRESEKKKLVDNNKDPEKPNNSQINLNAVKKTGAIYHFGGLPCIRKKSE